LFELEKRYGEFKRPKREKKVVKKVVAPVDDESKTEDAEPKGV